MEPWFLYDGLRTEGDEDRARAILARHAARRPDGSYAYAGWPKYAEGILTAKELENVERRDARDFPFERRAPRLLEVIKEADPDVFSLVECDEYEAFWRGRLEELGYGSVWHKRPRASAPDGCCLGFRERDWALDAHKTVSYDDHDRTGLMGVLRRKDTGERFVFVSTHLARNPESLKQQGLRLRQVAQLMRELHTFYKEQGIDTAEVPAIVAGDLNAESLQEVTAVAAAVCGLRDLDVHPLLFASNEVPSPVTSQTMRRKSRIDYVVFSDNGLLERVDDDKAPLPLNEEACIPDATHPSDHLPVIGSFRFADKAARSLFCARRVVRDILEVTAPRPLLCGEVALAFEALGGRVARRRRETPIKTACARRATWINCGTPSTCRATTPSGRTCSCTTRTRRRWSGRPASMPPRRASRSGFLIGTMMVLWPAASSSRRWRRSCRLTCSPKLPSTASSRPSTATTTARSRLASSRPRSSTRQLSANEETRRRDRRGRLGC